MAQPSPYLADRIRPASPSNLYMQDRAQELKDQWGQGQYAQAIGTAARTAIQGAGMYALEAGDKLTSPWIDAAKGFGRGLVGDAAAQPAAPAAPAAPAPVGPSNPTDQRLAAGTQAAPMGLAAAALASPPSTGNVTRVGNSYSGTNVSGDITVNGQAPAGGFMVADAPQARGFQPGMAAVTAAPAVRLGFRPGMGSPATSSAPRLGFRPGMMAAADALADRSQAESMGRLMASGQIAAPAAGPSLIMSGNTGFRRDSRFLAQELGAQRALDRAQGRDPASLARAAGLQRTAMEQQGANQRSLWQYALDQQRINQQGEAQGYTNRTNRLVEEARNQVAAEQDPARRRSLVQYMRDIEGRAEPADPYLVVPGGQQIDPTSQRAYNTPASVFNRQTGQFVQQPQGQGGVSPIGENQQAIAIRDNPNLSREQKVEALRKLGYS